VSKRGLGKGLKALIPTTSALHEGGARIEQLPVGSIEPNAYQPRRVFDDDKLEELATSIMEHGVVQPVVVRPIEGGRYELVAGERRWRACRKVGLEFIPAVVKDMTDRDVTEVALIENIQREDLNPLEEAWAYRTLMDEFNLTQEEVAARVGKSRPHVANTLRLLSLPPEVREMVVQGTLTAGHARALVALGQAAMVVELARVVQAEGLNVRQTEERVRHWQGLGESRGKDKKQPGKERGAETRQDKEIDYLVEKLQDALGTKVRIFATKNGGRIELEYYSDEDLTRLVEAILGE